jgi:hypothetical protein
VKLDIASLEANPLVKWSIITLSVAFGAGLFVWFFTQLDTEGNNLGIDLIFYAFRGWDIHYHVVNGLRNPPWSVLVLIPFGALLPDTASWGLLAYATLIGLILSVPGNQPKWKFNLSIILLVTAFPTLRVIADAQLEILVIGGILATVYGLAHQNPYALALGSLFATTKPQAVFVLMPIVGIYMLLNWPRKTFFQAVALVGAVVIPTMLWRGEEWLAAVEGTYQRGGLIDISMSAALHRMEFVPIPIIYIILATFFLATMWMVWISDRSISREKAAFLSAASMLLAPYTAGNSVLIVLAVGIVSLLRRRLLIALLIFAVTNSFYYFNQPENATWFAYFWTTYLLANWLILAWDIYQVEVRKSQETAVDSTGPTPVPNHQHVPHSS